MTEMDQITPVLDVTLSWLRSEPVRKRIGGPQGSRQPVSPELTRRPNTQRPEGYF
jgi:hypothetical protein